MAILDVKRCVPAFLIEENSERYEKPTIIGGYPSMKDARGKLHSIAINLMEKGELFTCSYGRGITWYKKETDDAVQTVHAQFRIEPLSRVLSEELSLRTDDYDVYGFLDRY